MLICVHLHFFLTNVVPGGDFSVYGSLSESEKLSLEGTFSTDCHMNFSLLPVRAKKCTASFLFHFSVYGSLTESEKLSSEGTFSTVCHVEIKLVKYELCKVMTYRKQYSRHGRCLWFFSFLWQVTPDHTLKSAPVEMKLVKYKYVYIKVQLWRHIAKTN